MIYIKHEKSDIMTNESYHIKICMNISVQKFRQKARGMSATVSSCKYQ